MAIYPDVRRVSEVLDRGNREAGSVSEKGNKLHPNKPLKRFILKTILIVAKYTGAFAICRMMTAGDLRILCYHGAALLDENEYSPGLFMTEATFAKRLRFLRDHGFNVLPLDAAIPQLKQATLPAAPVVITIDDGWYGTFRHFYPALKRFGAPATLYITTYYYETQTQVFNVAVSYAMWKARDRSFDLGDLNRGLEGEFGLNVFRDRQKAADILIAEAEKLTALERQQFLRQIYQLLALDGDALEDSRAFCFVNEDEAREMAANGISCQLHTHRHRFPADDAPAARLEISDNRASMASISDEPLVHFCYPDGVYQPEQAEILHDLGVVSATTNDYGFNKPDKDPYRLSRFLDSERISDLEFEAEMAGFFEMVRRLGLRI